MKGLELARLGHRYTVKSKDTEMYGMEFRGVSDKGRYVHFENVHNDISYIFDLEHPGVIEQQFEILE